MKKNILVALLLSMITQVSIIPPVFADQDEIILSIEKAVKMALQNGPGIKPNKTMILAAEAARKKAFAKWFPIYTIDLQARYYSEKPGIGEEMAFNITEFVPPESNFDAWLLSTLSSMSDMFSSFESKQYEVNLSLTIKQPLTPLYQVYYANKLAEINVNTAKIKLKQTESNLIYNVKETYFTILKLKESLKALNEAITSVSSHVQKAELFFAQNLITKNDLLQAKARLSEMETQRINLESAIHIATEGLNSLIGFKPGTKLVLQDTGLSFSGKVPDFDEAMKVAIENRPDIKELIARSQSADIGKKIVEGNFIPQIAAFGSYTHNEGSVMKYPDFTIGGVLSWDFWSFGSKYYELEEAKLQKQAVEEAIETTMSVISVEIHDAITKIKSSLETFEKEKATIAASEEQLRIEKERYAQNVSTSTDVLDAQSRLTQAMVQRASAWFDIFIALAKLEKATGKEWK